MNFVSAVIFLGMIAVLGLALWGFVAKPRSRVIGVLGAGGDQMQTALPPLVAATDRIVLFDGVCKLCGAWARFLIRFDRNHVFKLASVQSEEGKAILEWLGMPTDYYKTMVLVEGSQAYVQSTAFIRVVARLPFPWPMASIVWLIPAFIRNWLYDRVALNRYAIFGRHPACVMPSPDHERRFLSATAGT